MKTSVPQGVENMGSVDPVATAISNMILDGIYGPGDRLKLTDIAARLGISVTPVREALWKLEGSGLVQNIPNRGAVVRAIDEQYITNLYDVRAAIESMLIEKSIAAATSSQLERIDRARLAYEKAARNADAKGILPADAEFHSAINSIAQNDVAIQTLKGSFQLISSLRLRIGFDQHRIKEVIREHAAIAEAFRSGDARAAAQMARRHANGARESLIQALRIANSNAGT
jgi:DNA-binding GntR family transcriptional regulator